MTYVNLNVDVDLDDVISSLSDRKIQCLVDELYDDGYLPTKLDSYNIPTKLDSYNIFITNDEFGEMVSKLNGTRLTLTPEDESIIRNILAKY